MFYSPSVFVKNIYTSQILMIMMTKKKPGSNQNTNINRAAGKKQGNPDPMSHLIKRH